MEWREHWANWRSMSWQLLQDYCRKPFLWSCTHHSSIYSCVRLAIPPMPTGYISQATIIENDDDEENSPSSCPQDAYSLWTIFSPLTQTAKAAAKWTSWPIPERSNCQRQVKKIKRKKKKKCKWSKRFNVSKTQRNKIKTIMMYLFNN